MSFQKDNDWAHESAMFDGTNKVNPCGEGSGYWPMIPSKIQKALNLEPKLSFGQDSSHWKALREKKEMVPLLKELREAIGKRKIHIPSLKRVLNGLGVLHRHAFLQI
jgi:hypothetical protein